jgi:integrase
MRRNQKPLFFWQPIRDRLARFGKIAGNPCEGIKNLYSSGNRSEIVWRDADIATIKKACSVEIAHAVDLGAATGLRLGDLLRLSWPHIQDDAIVITTSKSNHKRQAIIPLYDGLREVLARIPKRATTVLTNSLGRPWTAGGFAASFHRAKIAAGIGDLHFHDLRGTAATKFYIAGLPERVIAEILGWQEENVGRIIRRYVDRTAATRAIILQLNKRAE